MAPMNSTGDWYSRSAAGAELGPSAGRTAPHPLLIQISDLAHRRRWTFVYTSLLGLLGGRHYIPTDGMSLSPCNGDRGVREEIPRLLPQQLDTASGSCIQARIAGMDSRATAVSKDRLWFCSSTCLTEMYLVRLMPIAQSKWTCCTDIQMRRSIILGAQVSVPVSLSL